MQTYNRTPFCRQDSLTGENKSLWPPKPTYMRNYPDLQAISQGYGLTLGELPVYLTSETPGMLGFARRRRAQPSARASKIIE